jgi:uncharacterized protein YqeY
MSVMQRLDDDLRTAMKSGDTVRRDTIRLLRNAIKKAEIDNRGPLDDDGEERVLAREAKQRRESIEEYRKGRREDLVAREEAELAVISEYLPEQLSEDDMRALVLASIRKVGARGMGDLGAVMRDVMPEIRGRADGAAVNAMARQLLATVNG